MTDLILHEARFGHTVIDQPRLTQHVIQFTSASTVGLTRDDTYASLVVDGRTYPLVMAKFMHGRPEIETSLQAALVQVQDAIAVLDYDLTFAQQRPPRVDDVPTENPDVDTTPETAGPSPLRRPRCGCGAVATIWDDGHFCAAHYLELPAPQLFCPSCLCVAEQTDIEHTPDAWRCRNPACLSVAKLDDLLTLSALIERRAALDRIKVAVCARMRALPDIALGRELCALRWQKFSSFVAMLVNAPEARLTHYASAYVAFVRDYNPESDLTPARVLREWQRLIDGPSPAAPAMMRAA